MEKESWILATVLGISSVAAVSVYLIMKIVWGRRYKLPPGPWAWPIVGNLSQLKGGNGFYYKVLEFRQAYGNIFRLKMGVHNVFFVFGHQYVQEILGKHGDLMTKRPNWMYIPDKILKRKGKMNERLMQNIRRLIHVKTSQLKIANLKKNNNLLRILTEFMFVL